MFKLGNHNIDEILYATAQDFNSNLLYTLDQLSSASIEITAESTDITDKKGNVVRTLYTSKAGTFTATNAFLHPAIMNASSGSKIEVASEAKKIAMPKIVIVSAGGSADVTGATNIKVIGLFGNGANSVPLTLDTNAAWDEEEPTYKVVTAEEVSTLTVPAAAEGAPIQYLVKFDREVASGIKLINTADKFPDTVRLTLFCSYVDPCDDTLKPVYVYIPSFMADPSVTISLDRETQEMDFNGNIQMDYCGVDKTLYVLYYPDEDLVVTGITE